MKAKIISEYKPADPMEPSMEQLAVYELFDVEIVKDVNDKDVQIPRSLGQCTLESLQNELAKIQEKIDIISNLKI
jgi:hypothetical protein